MPTNLFDEQICRGCGSKRVPVFRYVYDLKDRRPYDDCADYPQLCMTKHGMVIPPIPPIPPVEVGLS